MVRMGRGLRSFLELRVTFRAHLVRFITKLQGCAIGGFIVRVRVVACAATDSRFLKTLRALEGFDDECGLAEAAVLVKPFARKLAEGNHQIADKKRVGDGIIQLAMRTGRANGGLHVTLRADRHEIAIIDFFEINGRIERTFLVLLARVH